MSRTKDLYMDEFERRLAAFEDQGMDPDTAYERAGFEAYEAMADHAADMADRAWSAEKDRRNGL